MKILVSQAGCTKFKRLTGRIVFPILGLASLIWFLVRVIPKPSRAAYPCMKVAFPIASGFVTWLMGLMASVSAFKLAKQRFQQAHYWAMGLFIVTGAIAGFFTLTQMSQRAASSIAYNYYFPANQPIGQAKGIFPGRVAWAWNPDATNENQTGKDDGRIAVSENDDYYFLIKNNNQAVIDSMMDAVVLNLTGETTVSDAWRALFRFHNRNKSGKDSSYAPGEKIFIKINATSILQGDGGQPWHTWEPTQLTKYKPTWWAHPDVVETTPQIVLSVLRQLVNHAGVRQQDIYIGDPMKNVYKHLFDYWKAEFPDVNVLGNDIEYHGLNLAALGRVPVVKTASDLLFYSDKGKVMNEALSDKLYTIHEQAAYLINIASLKAHACAGITLCAKNHFGSQARADASHLHKGLLGEENDRPYRTDYGLYRVQVDLMGHRLLGGNTVLFVVDGLYSAIEGWSDAYPIKWKMAPFNNDFTNSIFASLDPVALESVCFDFLRTEYHGPQVEFNRPNMAGVDDYLRQAADSTNWPAGIVYDPENDGTPISSLGVYEHWNNPIDMQYSRNLGTGEGIELVKLFPRTTAVEQPNSGDLVTGFQLKPNYPNPFNASTTIAYHLAAAARVKLSIYNLRGERVISLVDEYQNAGNYSLIWHGVNFSGAAVASGVYVSKLEVNSASGNFVQARRMVLQK
ncbi:MAG: DUF362 domain-containing protein [candidate division KSB1 bacterium]|nr:DUF362 domain-containing protein [candidate division KSB1 bacterium]